MQQPQNDDILMQQHGAVVNTQVNKVLKNTYLLLGMLIGACALATFVGMALNVPRMPGLLYIAVAFGLLFGIEAKRDSVVGLGLAFVLAAFLGANAAPMISFFAATSHGQSLIVTALGMTSVAFFVLSAIAFGSKTPMTGLRSFYIVGVWVMLAAILINFFMQVPFISVAISAAIVLLACIGILWRTNAIVLGGETNYISAATGLFVDLYVLFMNLLSLLGIFSGDD